MNDGARPIDDPLYHEHLALGVRFGEQGEPSVYTAGEHAAAREAVENGAVLCDASSATMLLLSGDPAPDFAHIAFAGEDLSVASCAWSASLTGDGSVASVPLLARTGDAEYLAIDGSARGETLTAWLSFLSSVEQGGTAPFAGMTYQDVTRTHAALVLWGTDAPAILEDYLHGAPACAPGEVRSCALDRIPAIVVGLPSCGGHGYLLLVPPRHAVVLWRSLLSFGQVTPIGVDALRDLFARDVAWARQLVEGDVVRFSVEELGYHKLIRESRDFVGARGLVSAQEGRQS